MELFIRDATEADVRAWLEDAVGPLTKTSAAPVARFETEDGRAVVITERVEGGPFVSVWLHGTDWPWAGLGACANAAHAATGQLVTYQPPPGARKPWQWVVHDAAGRRRVDQVAFR